MAGAEGDPERPADAAELLERAAPLAVLNAAVERAGTGPGAVVLIGGEAGIGKTSVVRHLVRSVEAHGHTAVLGWCDPVETPAPLGPLLDMAPDIAAGFAGCLAEEGWTSRALHGRVLAELSACGAPRLIVFEDVHWADQATLDLLRFLGRRAERLRTAVVVTFRDDEAGASSPLAVLLGDLATAPGVTRLSLAPLSREGTARLVAGSRADPGRVYARTGGNPFFVHAVLSSGGPEVPKTVREVVLARLARLAPETGRALEAAAIIGARVDPAVLAAVLDKAGTPRWAIQDGVASGLLVERGDLLGFRHELVQAAITDSCMPSRRENLHSVVLDVLESRGSADLGELVRHAEGAGDDATVRALAPAAAEWAAGRGAHREAAVLYRKTIGLSRDRPASTRADLLEREAEQRYLSNGVGAALRGYSEAAALRGGSGDRLGESRNLVRVSTLSFLVGDYARGEAADGGIESALAGLPPSAELAMAYDNQSWLRLCALEFGAAAHWARKALTIAHALDDPLLTLTSRISHAEALLMSGEDEAATELRSALREAQSRGPADQAARAAFALVFLPMFHRRYDGAEACLDQGAAVAARHGLAYWAHMISGARARFLLEQARWTEAEPCARALLEQDDLVSLPTMHALITLGRIRARRGEGDAAGYLERALTIGRRQFRIEAVTHAWPATAEAAWLAGDTGRVIATAEAALAWGKGSGNPWWSGELTYWLHRVGRPVELHSQVPEPYRLAIGGDWAAAAGWWESRGCHYEAAIDLSSGDDPAAVRRAVATLDGLGAHPAAALARRRLREFGETAIPRGPRPSTRASKAGLTRRESEVLELVAAGLTNCVVARRLFLSRKTVERHMSAVLRKLGARSRSEAVEAARRRGVLGAGGERL